MLNSGCKIVNVNGPPQRLPLIVLHFFKQNCSWFYIVIKLSSFHILKKKVDVFAKYLRRNLLISKC